MYTDHHMKINADDYIRDANRWVEQEYLMKLARPRPTFLRRLFTAALRRPSIQRQQSNSPQAVSPKYSI
jgi:hypothetical protein